VIEKFVRRTPGEAAELDIFLEVEASVAFRNVACQGNSGCSDLLRETILLGLWQCPGESK
jgi:hypothetical protein